MTGQSSTSSWPERALPKRVVQWLFDQMLAKWGKSFVDKWAATDREDDPDFLIREWAKALYGLTEAEFKKGVAKLKDFERPPSQPEFLRACRPDVNPLNAYYEALEGARSRERGEVGTWSHPAIFFALKRVSAFDMLNQTYSQVRERWEKALEAELEKGEWEEIPAPPKRLEAPKNNTKAREEAAKMMQHYREAVQVQTPPAVDPKRWAKRIMERHKNGDKTLLPIQVQFAREALGINNEDLTNG